LLCNRSAIAIAAHLLISFIIINSSLSILISLSSDLSIDHKPDDPEEQRRIEAAGGFVAPPADVGLSARVYLDPNFTRIGLAMSRSIGDYAVKTVGVIPEPENFTYDVQENYRFMILASDGVWEFISSQEAVNIVLEELRKEPPSTDDASVEKTLVMKACQVRFCVDCFIYTFPP
jgi:serine/threonine protein phosphatase PrpC